MAGGGTVSSKDILAAQIDARVSDAGITYFAFTTTPKVRNAGAEVPVADRL